MNNDSVIQVHDIDSGALVSAAAPFGSVGLRWSRMERHIATSGFETIIWAAPGDQLTRHRGTVPGISRVGS
ncbi:MAG TPA: hypothetical protein VH089_10970 [Streptosporangiaceae bacterium]|nr:hypothetical protein [Streptosporangiaceae bacterium]